MSAPPPPRGCGGALCGGALWLRVLHLVVISFAAVSTQTYDWPGAVAPYLERSLGVTGEQLGALYAAYHAPNIVLVLFGGLAVDVLGADVSVAGFAALILVSALLLVAGRGSLATMLASRALLGAGSESLQVAQCALLNRAFDRLSYGEAGAAAVTGKGGGSGVGAAAAAAEDCARSFPRIAMAYAFSNIALRATSLIMLFVLPGLTSAYGWSAMWLIVALSVFSLLVAGVLLVMEQGWVPCCSVAPAAAAAASTAHGGGETDSTSTLVLAALGGSGAEPASPPPRCRALVFLPGPH
jgi:hypothetical protein